MKKLFAMILALVMILAAVPVLAEDAQSLATTDAQKLDASYSLALNAINAEDYETANTYLDICFVYCDPQTNPEMYADLLLKRACIYSIRERDDLALLLLDASLQVQPDLANAYLVRTQIYAAQNDVDAAVENLEKYIDLTKETALYETVAQLQEAKGDLKAAQAAYDKYVQGAGADVPEAGFQSGLYRMQAGRFEEAVAAFEAYAEDETYGAGAKYNIGVCKMNLADYAGAVAEFTACEEKGGTFEGLFYNRGICRMMSDDWEGAAADFEKSIEKEPYADDARYNLAICRMQLEDYEKAIALFTEVIGDGENAEAQTEDRAVNEGAWYYRGICRAATGDLEGALADYTVCIDRGYELAQSYYQRAQIYGAMGDTEKQNSDLQNSMTGK